MSTEWKDKRNEAIDLSVRVKSMPLHGIVEQTIHGEDASSDASPIFELGLAGHKGYGLFATKDIPKGTRILAEKPCILLPPNEPKIALSNQLVNIKSDPARYAEYTDLSSNDGTLLPAMRHAIRTRLSNGSQYSGEALDVAVEDMVRCHAIFFTNAVTLGPKGCHGEGLFLQYSRINHSCLPNVQNSYNPEGFELVHAIRDIPKGEELLTSYTSNLRSREHRQQDLSEWGFECQCDACEGDAAAAHESRRRRLEEIDRGLGIFEKATPLMRAISSFPFPRHGGEALAWAEEAVGLLKEEGLLGVDLSQAYRQCSKLSMSEGQLEKAMAYAKKEMEVERICLGEETDWLDTSDQPYASAKSWVKHLENTSERDKIKLRMNEKRHAKEQKKADKKAAKKALKGAR